MGTEPRKGTPEGDQFDGKVYMGLAVVAFLVLLVVGAGVLAFIIGGIAFLLGALKWHAGLTRRR